MLALIQKIRIYVKAAFWILPGLIVLAGILAGFGIVQFDRSGIAPKEILVSPFVYNGDTEGARTLLATLATSTIGVAGTVFSITIAALSLAAGQMGPRLLRNFTQDRGNQVTLGIFLGTFCYALMVMRGVRTDGEAAFTPYFSVSLAMLLAFLCVATLVYFVGHMASRINVDTVIQLVSEDLSAAITRFTSDDAQPDLPDDDIWKDGKTVRDTRHGYLEHLNTQQLADWAAANDTSIRFLIRPGHYIFPGAPIAIVASEVEGAGNAIVNATTISIDRTSSDDLEYAFRQLVEVAVRALSPGINDPNTAISALDRLGSALCEIAPYHLRNGVHMRDDKCVLSVPSIDYAGLTDVSFHMIRQNGSSRPSVIIRILDVLTAVSCCEDDKERVAELERHADLAMNAAELNMKAPADVEAVRKSFDAFKKNLKGRQPKS